MWSAPVHPPPCPWGFRPPNAGAAKIPPQGGNGARILLEPSSSETGRFPAGLCDVERESGWTSLPCSVRPWEGIPQCVCTLHFSFFPAKATGAKWLWCPDIVCASFRPGFPLEFGLAVSCLVRPCFKKICNYKKSFSMLFYFVL